MGTQMAKIQLTPDEANALLGEAVGASSPDYSPQA